METPTPTADTALEEAPPPRPPVVVGPHAQPRVAEVAGSGSRGFVLAVLAGAVLVLAGVFGFDALVNPYGNFSWAYFPRVLPSDPEAKVDLVERLPAPPQIVVLGSSRSMGIDPSYISRLTGRRAFNFGVRGGTPADEWAIVNWLHDRDPARHTAYLWMLDDAGLVTRSIPRDLVTSPALARYFPARLRAAAPTPSLWRLLSWNGLQDAYRATQVRGINSTNRFLADGAWRSGPASRSVGAPGNTFAQRIRRSTSAEGALTSFAGSTIAAQYAARTLAALHRWHDPVVVVLSPEQPLLLRLLAGHGWNTRHAQILAWLRGLQRSDGFVLLDMHSITSFGGSPDGFMDGTHMLPGNLEKLVSAVLREDHGALQ
jgi:hypothetical protein